jgi:hypothetical protein
MDGSAVNTALAGMGWPGAAQEDWPWAQGGAEDDSGNLLVRGTMGYYTPLDGVGSDGQAGANGRPGTNGWGPLATLDDFGTGVWIDDHGDIHGLQSRETEPIPPTQDDNSQGSDDTLGRLRQFSFDEDMGTPRELPDWANNQRFGLGKSIPDIDDLSGEIYKGTARPWADDFLANYEKEQPDNQPLDATKYPRGWEIFRRAGGDIAKEGAKSKTEPDSCALRISRALDTTDGGRYAIPVNPDDHLSIDGTGLKSYDTAYSELPDQEHHATLGYLSNASEMNTYLQHTWGAPDASITWGPEDNTETMKAKIDAIQKSLGPGEAAVFARPNHTGVITSDYMDHYAEYPGEGTMNVWILRSKRQ